MNNIVEVTEANFEPEVLHAATPVVADVYAPWCGPCRMLGPVLEQLAGEFEGKAKFVKINVDEATAVAARYGITGVPTLLFFHQGEVRDSVVGLASLAALRSRISQVGNPAGGVMPAAQP